MTALRRLVVAICLALTASAVLSFRPGIAVYHTGIGPASPTTRPTVTADRRSTTRPAPIARPLNAASTVLAFPGPPVQARAAILVDEDTGKVLFAKNADERLPMASTTKITTAAIVLQHARLSDMVRASHAAATIGESTMSLRQGERLSVRDLLYGLLLNSGNDAAVALAEHVGGTQAHFVAMMNALAHTLHMRNTHYATPHGLDAPNHYTSARDLATVALYAMRDPTFRRIVATESYHIRRTKHNQEHWLGNINKALYWYPGTDGVKPGDTDAAGLCLVVSAHRNGHYVLAVTLHTPNLATDIRNLLNMGTHDFQWVPSIYAADQPSTTITGGSGDRKWTYFYGAGHYVSGPFLDYFSSHGGVQSLGYPRTERLTVDGQTVQYFEGAELVFDSRAHSVSQAPLGEMLAASVAPLAGHSSKVAAPFAHFYKVLAGRRVLGTPLTGLVHDRGTPVQFFQDGELADVRGAPVLVPAGDAAMRLSGWLPAAGAADTFPPTMAPPLEDRYHRPAVRRKRSHLPLSVLAHRFHHH